VVVPPHFDRQTALHRLASEDFDVLVIGGGVTGCGVALDAAARGLRTALVEAGDFASGTSSKSSKLVHGGLRYLQQHDYLLVYEALQERQRLIHNAPHLVHPLPFLIPLFGRDGVVSKSVAKAYSAALWLYDVTGGWRIGKRHRRIDKAETLAHFPHLSTDRLVASFLYWDAQADDARLTLTLARTAAARGAVVANYSPVEALIERSGRVGGARLAGGTEVRATRVVNAGGVWSEEVARLTGAPGDHPDGAVPIRPAKGVHIAVPAARLPCDYASVLMVPGEKRSIFVVPWAADQDVWNDGVARPDRYTYLGTTDTDYHGPLDDPQCTAEDIAYILKAVNAWTSAALTPEDVTGTWAGLRPLINDARSARTADLSRRHRVIVGDNGLVTVTGGKLTTYRKMAADTVDAVLDGVAGNGRLAQRVRRRATPSPTRRLVLIGGEGRGKSAWPAQTRRLAMSAEQLAHLHGRYGSETAEVIELCAEDPTLVNPLVPGLPYLRAEAVYAARHEMVCTLDDVLSRRTRSLILNRQATGAAAADVAALIGPELGWDDAEQARQVDDFRRTVDAELRATQAATPAAPAAPAAQPSVAP
jgi:glycerol-3-phosphate dehydrogenase